jgi:hypothetical protein
MEKKIKNIDCEVEFEEEEEDIGEKRIRKK